MTGGLRAEQLVYGLRAARAPAFVPGRSDRLLYLRRTPDERLDLDRGALELLELDSGTVRGVRPEERDVRSYALDGAGRLLATVEGAAGALHVAPFDPDRPQIDDAAARYTSISGVDAEPAWSPAGDLLALTLAPERADPDAPQVVEGRWYKEDGQGFVGAARRQVLVHDVAADTTALATEEPEGASHPAWTPDGSVLAVRTGGAEGWPWASVAILDPATGACLKRLERYAGTVESLLFADAGELLFVGSERRPLTFQTDLLAWRWETDELRVVAGDLPWQIWSAGFHVSPSPLRLRDAGTLWLGGVERACSGLYSIDLASGRHERLHADRALRGGFALSSDGEFVAQERSAVDSAGELVVLRIADGTEQTVTALNHGLAGGGWSAPRVTRLDVTRDGAPIDAWLLTGPGEVDPSAPLVLDIHGGPHNFYGEFFLPEHQLLAANGFVVAYCNPRGSASYGPDFAAATAGAWGTDDTDDVLAVLQAAREVVGGTRDLFASGWSYGGFQVLTLLGRHPELFKAAVCGAPAADFRSWYGTSDAPTMAADELGGRPHELSESRLERSPANGLHAIRTPLLLLHGLDDMRSPVGQTELAHRVATDAGATVRYVRYPGASHGFRLTGRPSRRAHVLGEILGWFETWRDAPSATRRDVN